MDNALTEHWKTAPGDIVGALLAHTDMLALCLDPQGRVSAQSRALHRLIGPMEGAPLSSRMAPEEGEAFDADVLPGLMARGTVDNVQIALRDARGVPVPLRLSAMVQQGEGEARIIALMSDQRETRAALAALDRKAAEAEEASEAKSRFLAAMGHEIRTPMNAILGFAQLLDLSDLDEERRGHVRAILSAGNAMMTLLTDLLDHSQVEAGRMRVEERAFDLFDMLDEVDRWWRASAVDKGLASSVSTGVGLPRRIVSDRGRIQQVLNNYLGNAVKFTEAGRITLSVDPVPSAPGAGAHDVTIRFTVVDSGPGIAPEDVARLYQPFVQIAGEGGAERNGWGLGLSICANIAEAMGARVGVESQPGAGSVFWFELPTRVPAEPPAVEHVPDNGEGCSAVPRRVLLAEDNALNQDVMRRMLREIGHEVVTVSNGFEMLAALEAEVFDAVVTDVMMPGLDGVAATRRLRASDLAQREIPVIGCSAHVSAEAEAQYRAIGMTGFLPKPVTQAGLRAAIEAAFAPSGGASTAPAGPG